MEYIPWFVWIVLAAIAGGVVITVATSFGARRSEMTGALQQGTETNERLFARLEGSGAPESVTPGRGARARRQETAARIARPTSRMRTSTPSRSGSPALGVHSARHA